MFGKESGTYDAVFHWTEKQYRRTVRWYGNVGTFHMVASRVRLQYTKSEQPELEAGANLRVKNDFMMPPVVIHFSSSNFLQAATAG
jgi:hypothetical protein